MTEAILAGKLSVFYLNTAAAGCTPVFEKIAYQRDASLTRSTTMMDTSSKDTGDFESVLPSTIQDKFNCSGCYAEDEDRIDTLLDAQAAGASVLVRNYIDGVAKESGVVYIEECTRNFPHKDVSTYTVSGRVSGGLKKIAA